MINAQFSGEKVFSNSSEAFSLHEKSRFGEKLNGRIEYSFSEALYLLKNGKAGLFFGNKEIEFIELLKKIRKHDKKIEIKSRVFEDLRKKGYIVKTALKFGADFRVYDKGIRPGEDHAKWILYAVKENEVLRWHDFAAKNRIAHSTKKSLLLAIVDEEDGVSYYDVSWIRP